MGVNRFMTPAELPKVSFFQLPYDQMKEGIMSAQMQQDTAREGISQIGDISFNYLTNATNDVDLAKNIYGELDQKTQGILSKQGNGDLRGLRGEIYNLGKEVGRWYKPDGKIGRLQSNYLQYMDWYKRQTENKDLDKTYVNYMANKFIKDYDANGGVKAGNIYTEDLEKLPDVPKLIKDMEPLIKTTIKEKAYAMTNGKYMSEGKDAYEVLGPEKVRNVIAGYLSNSPDYYRFMTQAGRHEYFSKDQLPLVNPVEKEYTDKKGKKQKYIDYAVNDKNPYAASIYAAMEGLSRNDHKQDRHLKGDPYGTIGYSHSFDEKPEPLIESNIGEVIMNKQDQINKLQENYTGTPEQTALLQAAAKDYGEIIAKHVLDNKGQIKPEWKPFFEGIKDLNGKEIPSFEVLQGFVLAQRDPKYNGGHGLWNNAEIMKTYLESKGYKLNYTLNDGLGKKVLSMFSGLLRDKTDVQSLNDLDESIFSGFSGKDYKPFNDLYSDLRTRQKQLVGQPIVTQQSPLKIVPPDSKNPIFRAYQNLNTLKTQASAYNFINPTTGEGGSLSQLLDSKAYAEKTNVGFATSDPNSTNPYEPQRTFIILQPLDKKGKPDGPPERIEIFSKTPGTQNQLAVAASHSLQNNKDFYGSFSTGNNTGWNGRVNLYNASDDELMNQDNYNENGK